MVPCAVLAFALWNLSTLEVLHRGANPAVGTLVILVRYAFPFI